MIQISLTDPILIFPTSERLCGGGDSWLDIYYCLLCIEHWVLVRTIHHHLVIKWRGETFYCLLQTNDGLCSDLTCHSGWVGGYPCISKWILDHCLKRTVHGLPRKVFHVSICIFPNIYQLINLLALQNLLKTKRHIFLNILFNHKFDVTYVWVSWSPMSPLVSVWAPGIGDNPPCQAGTPPPNKTIK